MSRWRESGRPRLPGASSGPSPLRRGACLPALVLLAAFPLAGEPVPVPGGPDSIRRLLDLGSGRPAQDFFLDVNRALLTESNPRDPWEKNPRRQAVVRFAEDLAEWKAAPGCGAVLSARGERWDATRHAIEWLGFRVSGDGPGFVAEARPEPEARRRQAFLDILGQNAYETLRRLSAGEEVTVSCGDADAPLPFGLELWKEIMGPDASGLGAETAFLHFVTHVPASRMLVALHSVDARTLEAARSLAGPAPGAGVLKLLYDEALDGFERFPEALVLRDGRVQLPGGAKADDAWANVVGVPTAERAKFVAGLFRTDSGKPAYVADALRQVPEPAATAFVLGRTGGGGAAVTRFRRLYDAIETVGENFARGQRGAWDFAHLLKFVSIPEDGRIVAPAGAALWLEALSGSAYPEDEEHLGEILDDAGKRREERKEFLLQLQRRQVEGAVGTVPAQKRFVLVSSLVRAKPVLADPGTIVLLVRGLERFLPSYGPLEDLPLDDPAVVRRYLFTLNRLDTTGTGRGAELRAGLFQASVDLLAAFCRSGSLGEAKARDLVRSLLDLSLFAVPRSEPTAGIPAGFASFDGWLRGELLAALRAEETRALAAPRGEGAGPAGERPPVSPTSDDLVASALAGWRPAVTLAWRAGRYTFDPTADGVARRKAFAATQQCARLAELEAAAVDLDTALKSAREGDPAAMRIALAHLLESLSADRPAGREEDARILSVAADARSAVDELARATGAKAFEKLRQRQGRLDAFRAERTLEALALHVYSSSVSDPADLTYTDASLVRRHRLAWGDRRSGLVESPFGPTRLETLDEGRGSRIAGSYAGLAELLGELHAGQLVHEQGATLSSDSVRTGLVGPVVRVTPARLDDDALRFVALSCRAAEELAAALDGRPEAERYDAWSALAADLVPVERLNGLAAATESEIGQYLTPSDLFRAGRRLAFGPPSRVPAGPAARGAFEAWTRLVSRVGEAEASRRVAEFGPRPWSWAGLSRLVDLDLPSYERLSRYREPQLFADRLSDLKVAVARSVFDAGDPAVLLPVLLAPALDDLFRVARMTSAFDWRALVAAHAPLGERERDRILEEALSAGRILLEEEAEPK